jgi:hypothetical protein
VVTQEPDWSCGKDAAEDACECAGDGEREVGRRICCASLALEGVTEEAGKDDPLTVLGREDREDNEEYEEVGVGAGLEIRSLMVGSLPLVASEAVAADEAVIEDDADALGSMAVEGRANVDRLDLDLGLFDFE